MRTKNVPTLDWQPDQTGTVLLWASGDEPDSRLRQELRRDHFSVPPPPPPLCTRTLTHTHAYHDKWPVTCLCERGTKGSTPSPQGWQSGSLGQWPGLLSVSATLDMTVSESFHLLAGVRRNLEKKTVPVEAGEVLSNSTAAASADIPPFFSVFLYQCFTAGVQ